MSTRRPRRGRRPTAESAPPGQYRSAPTRTPDGPRPRLRVEGGGNPAEPGSNVGLGGRFTRRRRRLLVQLWLVVDLAEAVLHADAGPVYLGLDRVDRGERQQRLDDGHQILVGDDGLPERERVWP